MLETKTKILACNASSSSLKFSLFEAAGELLLAEGGIDWTRKPTRLVFRRTGQQDIRGDLVNQQIACKEYAYEFGVDRPEITDWKWPY